MRLFEFFNQLDKKPLHISTRILSEGITHVEDLIIDDGAAGAERAIKDLAGLNRDTETVTIKWDGFPAVVFGRDAAGKLVFVDKHMYDKVSKGKMEFMSIAAYDEQRGFNRSDLWDKESIIRPLLEKIVPMVTDQYWMGDLMWSHTPPTKDGYYIFKPNTVEYRVKIDSPLGDKITKSAGGIAVHTFINGLGQSDVPLVGLKGLKEKAGITFLVGEMTEKPKIIIDKKVLSDTKVVIGQHKKAVTKFMADLTAMKGKSIITAMSPFITWMLEENDISGNIVPRFLNFLRERFADNSTVTAKFLGNNDGWLYQEDGGAPGLLGMWSMWAAVTDLKLHIKQQIDSQQQNSEVIATTDGVTAHEGYVFGAGRDKLKLIDRLGFSKANFAKHRISDDEIAAKQKMPLAAFCFGRMNPPTLGHNLVMAKTIETGGKNSYVFLSNSNKAPDDPLNPATKAAFIKAIYPKYAKHIVSDPVMGPIYAANWLYAKGFRNIAFIGGSDRLGKAPGSIEKLLNGWNSGPVRTTDNAYGATGREHVHLTFVSSGDRDPDAGGLAGISGSRARKLATAGDEAGFQKATGVGPNIKVGGKTLYQATREGMGITNQPAAPDAPVAPVKPVKKK